MKNWNKSTGKKQHESKLYDRRGALTLLGLGLMMPLTACGQGERKMRKSIVLNVVMYSYVNRTSIDILFNGEDLGVMSEYGGTGTVVGVNIPFGPQTLTWRLDGPKGMARNGETVVMKNSLIITPEQIPLNTLYLGLHLYPDDTAEVTFSDGIPERTARGREILSKRKK